MLALGWLMMFVPMLLGIACILFPASAPMGAWWLTLLYSLFVVGAVLAVADLVADVFRSRGEW